MEREWKEMVWLWECFSKKIGLQLPFQRLHRQMVWEGIPQPPGQYSPFTPGHQLPLCFMEEVALRGAKGRKAGGGDSVDALMGEEGDLTIHSRGFGEPVKCLEGGGNVVILVHPHEEGGR